MAGGDQIPLGSFLWKRIQQLGVGAVFGLPGDMNLALLDYLKDSEELHWVGNSNELNAAYAADGYSRIKGCPGVILTTCGVGELSAINGIAGSYSESNKIIHIIGATPEFARKNHLMIHHNLGENPDHKVYDKISSHVRVAHCWLDDASTDVSEIDRVIKECYIHSRPVYIYFPLDMVHKPIPREALDKPQDLEKTISSAQEEKATQAVLSAIYAAKNPILLVDALVTKQNTRCMAQKLADVFKFPTFCPPMGKSVIDETKSYFQGVYNGKVSYPGVQDAIESSSDLVLHLGPNLSDSNTGRFTSNIEPEKLVVVKVGTVIVRGKVYDDVNLKSFLSKLLIEIDETKLPKPEISPLPKQPIPPDADSALITQSWIWKRIGKFLKPGDVIFTDTGTVQFGIQDAVFPDVTYVNQGYFASLGNSLPTMFGGALAHREMGKDGRVILVIGDGALQLTIQELSTVIREKLNVIIMIINNRGYTIERAILNPKEEYHEIQTWDYQHMLPFFGLQDSSSHLNRVQTKDGFDRVVASTAYTAPSSIEVLEIVMDKMDVPWRLSASLPPRSKVG